MTDSILRHVALATLHLGALLYTLNAAAQDLNGSGPLHIVSDSTEINAVLPLSTHLMLEPASVEQFLDQLDGRPPDWRTVYGQGHHDPGHDDRLFLLNRERDARREGNPALTWLFTFAWIGQLSPFDPQLGGFPVALGPKFIPTRWGMVRFKAEEPPGNLVVIADEASAKLLHAGSGQTFPANIDVLMTGRLVPNESLVYDFSHDEEGLGLIMPFVRVEQVHYVLMR